jgi:hypothetical protein
VGIGNITKSQKKHAGILVLKASVQIVSGFFRVPKRFQKALTIGFLLPVSFGIQILLPVFLRRHNLTVAYKLPAGRANGLARERKRYGGIGDEEFSHE